MTMRSFYGFYKTVKSVHEKCPALDGIKIKVENSFDEAYSYYEEFMRSYESMF